MSESKCGTSVSEVKGAGEGADTDKDAGDGVDMAVGDGADEGAEVLRTMQTILTKWLL